MRYQPLNYESINLMAGTYSPSCVKSFDNQTFAFWERSLFQRALSVLEFDLPADWTGSIRDFFLYVLFRFGYGAVLKRDEYGLLFQPASITGIDVWYRPVKAIISNPAFTTSLELEIGKECELLKLTPDYMGVWDIITYYAEKLSVLDSNINTSLINLNAAQLIGAKNKAASEALKKMLDKVHKGEPAVIFDQKITNDRSDKSEDPFTILDLGNLKEKYLTTDQLADFRTLIHNFDTEIGIPTLPIEKKERMISDEATSLELDAVSRSQIWLETFNESADAVNAMFGTNFRARRREYPEGGAENEQRNNDNAGDE